jgi:peptide/nickel transport system ATP-binding protein
MNAPLNRPVMLQVSELRVELAGQVEVLAEVSFSLAAGEMSA